MLAQETWKFDNLSRIGGHAVTVKGNPRVVDGAVEFNGIDDAVFLDVHPLAGAGEFTLEVVFRPDRGGNAEQRFFHLQESGADHRMLLETRLTGDRWCLDAFVFSASGSKTLIDRERLHPLDAWYHVAMVYDRKWFRNYVDGVEQGAAEAALTPQGAGRTSAGARINLVDHYKGAIREARMTGRALRPAEFLQAR